MTTEPDAVPWRLRRATGSVRGVLAGPSLALLGRGISKFAIVVFLIIAARLLSRHEFGIYSYVLVLTSVFAILGDSQVSVVAGRDIAAGRLTAADAFWTALPVVVGAATLSAVGLLVFGLLDSFPGTTVTLLLIAGVFVVFNRLATLGGDVLRALGRFKAEAAIETGGTVLLVGVATALAAGGASITAVLAAFAGTAVLSTLSCLIVLRTDIGPPRPPGQGWRPLLRSGILVAFAASATAVAVRSPLVVLGSVGTTAAVASFSAALRFADAAYLLALTAAQGLSPAIMATSATDSRRAVEVTRRATLAALAVGAALAAVAAPFGSDITSAIFGSKYEEAGTLLSVLTIALPFMGVFWISFFGLLALGAERLLLWVSGGAALLSLLAGVLVIPGADDLGAAWVYVGVMTTMAVSTYLVFERTASA